MRESAFALRMLARACESEIGFSSEPIPGMKLESSSVVTISEIELRSIFSTLPSWISVGVDPEAKAPTKMTMKKKKAKIEQRIFAAMKPTKEAKTVFQKPKGFLGCKGSSIGV